MLPIEHRRLVSGEPLAQIGGQRPDIDGHAKNRIVPGCESVMKRGIQASKRPKPMRWAVHDRLDTRPASPA